MVQIKPIVDKAIANIRKIFSNKHEVGKQIGETVAGMAVGNIFREVVVNMTTVKVYEAERIYIDSHGSINHRSGHLVAVLYESEHGHHYKHTADKWYVWNGADWDAVADGKIRA